MRKTKKMKKKLSDKDKALLKRAFSKEATEKAIEMCKLMIEDPEARRQTIAFIRAVDGKEIRNTSEF